jgi:uncharacterized protein
MSIEFEWDEAKRLSNLENHKVDFRIAARVFKGPVMVREDTRKNYGEQRFRAIGETEGLCLELVFTERNGALRLISAWKAGRDAKRRYQTLHPR